MHNENLSISMIEKDKYNLADFLTITSAQSKISACSSSGYGVISFAIGCFLLLRFAYFIVGYFSAITI